MKKSFHIGLIKDEQDIEDLATEMRKYLKTLGEFCFCVGKDTNENRDSCAKSIFRNSGEDYLTCPMCNGPMNLIDSEDNGKAPHGVWSCEDCPGVIFEYYDGSNIEKLKKCLN